MLLLGDDARLVRIDRTLPPGGTASRVPRSVGTLHDASFGRDVPLAAARRIMFTLPSITKCAQSKGAEKIVVGTPISFHGELRAPVKHTVSLFGMSGPRQSQSWP